MRNTYIIGPISIKSNGKILLTFIVFKCCELLEKHVRKWKSEVEGLQLKNTNRTTLWYSTHILNKLNFNWFLRFIQKISRLGSFGIVRV